MKLLKSILLPGVLLLVVLNDGCRRSSSFPELNARHSPDWVRNAVLYEISPRAFSMEGTFHGISRRLPELKKLGVTVLVLEPVYPIGELNRQGTFGNPYSVRDYYEVNEDLGTLEDFLALVKAAHADGFRIILDLVAGYTSWDSRLLMEHPEWFQTNEEGSIISPKSDWVDVAALNYDRHELRKYMIEMMKHWVRETAIDGFRCSDADLVPTDFWEIARHELESIRPVCMISESPVPALHLDAFDLSYSHEFGAALDSLDSGSGAASLLDSLLTNESLRYPLNSLFVRFDEDREKNSLQGAVQSRLGENALRAGIVLTFTVPGIPLIFNGEETGSTTRLSLHEKTQIDWGAKNKIGDLYVQLCRLREKHPSLRQGEFKRLSNSADAKVFSFARSAESDHVIVVVNMSKDPQEFSLNPVPKLPNDFTDVTSQERVSSNESPWRFGLGGYGFKILVSN
ncbi:MAG: alpha-amylase family glycosyl hydrolase [Bacteroidota bacterium]